MADQPYRGIRRALGDPELYIPPSRNRSATRLTASEIPREQFTRHLGQSARLEANLTLMAYQHDVTATLPLKAGSRTSISRQGALSIHSVDRTANSVIVVLRETSMAGVNGFSWYWQDRAGYVLVNTKHRQALLGDSAQAGQFASYTTFFASSPVRTARFSMSFSLPDPAAGGPVVDDEWMKDAELVRLDMRLIGTVTRPLRIDSFVVGGARK